MTSDINPKILEKVENSGQPDNIKNFIYEILKLEYDKLDETNPRLKEDYKKLIKEYK